MATMPPPPAYSGDQAPPPSLPSQRVEAKHTKVYWIYWGVLFGTIITWIFTVASAADDAWFTENGANWGGFEDDCVGDNEYCSLFDGGFACQVLATLMVSFALITVVVAAFMRAPITGKLGLASGILLSLHAVFQLIAFSLMASLAKKYDEVFYYGNEPGPTFGVAVVAWILGTVGAIASLVLLRRATTDQDGPFRACLSKANVRGAPPAYSGEAPPASAPAGQP